MHILAVVFLGAYFIYGLKKHSQILRLLPLIIIGVAINYKLIIIFLQNNFRRFTNYYANNLPKLEPGMVKILWLIIVVFSLYLIYKKYYASFGKVVGIGKNNHTESMCVGIFCLIYIATQVVGLYFNYFDRVGLFFAPFVLPLFEKIGNLVKTSFIRRIYFVGVGGCFIIYFFLSCLGGGQYQYTFYF
jgi:hypothetical protein